MTWCAPVRRILMACVCTNAFVNCVGDKGVAPATRPAAETLGTIVVSPLNAIMAVGETLSVTPIGKSLGGTAMLQFDSVQYRLENVTDTAHVSISAAGVVTARSETPINGPVLLTVIAFKDDLAAADQAIIQVVDAVFPNPTLSLQPVPPDSARMAWGDSKTLTPIIQNTTGGFVNSPTLRLEYGPSGDSLKMQCYVPSISATATLTRQQLRRSSCGQNGNAGTVSLNQIHAFTKGTAWVHAHVTVFGIVLHDSVLYTMTNPYSTGVDVGTSYVLSASQVDRSSVFVAPGGTVYFFNDFTPSLGTSITFILDHPEDALPTDPPATDGGTEGNVTNILGYGYSTRKFVTPGVYHWTATVSGGIPPYTGATVTGIITVE